MVLNSPSIFPTPADLIDNEVESGRVKPRTTFYFVGGDFTEGSISGNATETEILDFVIPAGQVVNGIKITVIGIIDSDTSGNSPGIIRIKVGEDGSEVEVSRYQARLFSQIINATPIAVVDNLNWDIAQSVSITGQNDTSDSGSKIFGEQLLIEGF